MQHIHPFLMFQRGQAAEAMAFYVKLFGCGSLSRRDIKGLGPHLSA
jgi:predicted 3-demethylubiquinone-9 3-methyltransferase (glyoxalase superfamily)